MQIHDFCDRYPRFLETTETVPSRSRLNARWRAVIDWNKAILTGRRVLNLGCHDGRWSFAAMSLARRVSVGGKSDEFRLTLAIPLAHLGQDPKSSSRSIGRLGMRRVAPAA